MADVNLTYDDFISVGKAALIGNTTTRLALLDGDPLLALLQANAVGELILVAAVQGVIQQMRASTAVGADLDSFVADFGVERLEAKTASGEITLSLNPSATVITVIELGVSQVITSAGTATYNFVADTELPFYTTLPTPRYNIPIGLEEVTLPIQAVTAGTGSNVSVGALNTVSNPHINIVGVSNQNNIANGAGAETDEELRIRFREVIKSLGKGNRAAYLAAIYSVIGTDADVVFKENVDSVVRFRPGFVQIIAENGSGTLTVAEVNDITTKINEVKAEGVSFEVTTPTLKQLDISLRMIYNENHLGARTEAITQMRASIVDLINSTKIGDIIYFSNIIAAVEKLKRNNKVIHAVKDVTIQVVGSGINALINQDYVQGDTEVARLNTVNFSTFTTVDRV